MTGRNTHQEYVRMIDCTKFRPSWELILFTFAPPQETIKSFFIRRVVSNVIEEIWVAIITPGLTRPHTLFLIEVVFHITWQTMSITITNYHNFVFWICLSLVFAVSMGMFSTPVVVDPFTNVGIVLGAFYLCTWRFLRLLFSILVDFLCLRLA